MRQMIKDLLEFNMTLQIQIQYMDTTM